MVYRADHIIRLDGTTCLQLWRAWWVIPCKSQPDCRPVMMLVLLSGCRLMKATRRRKAR